MTLYSFIGILVLLGFTFYGVYKYFNQENDE